MVTVIVPIYNVEAYLYDCLYSIANQTYQDMEILCINDCTLDNSVAIVRRFMRQDSRFRLINHTSNRGLGGARNTGIRHAAGEFILFVDSDDALAPDMVEALVERIQADKSDAVICGVLEFYPDGYQAPSSAFHYEKHVPSACREIRTAQDRLDLTNIWPSAWNKLFRTEIIRKYDCRFPEKILYEDHEFYYSYFQHVKRYSYLNRTLYYYRKARPNSITSQITGREKEIFRIIQGISANFRQLFAADPPEVQQKAIQKISYRLLAERNYTLAPNRREWLHFCRAARAFLRANYNLALLRENIDTFYSPSDEFYRYIFSAKGRLKLNLKFTLLSMPVVSRIIRRLLHRPAPALPAPQPDDLAYKNDPVRTGHGPDRQ